MTIRVRYVTFAALVLAVLIAPPLQPLAHGTIIQMVSVSRTINGARGGFDDAVESGATQGDITQDILAELRLPTAYQGVAAAGRFGSIGVSAGLFESGVFATLATDVEISADFTNDTGSAQHGVLNFVIDGGSMLMVAARNSHIRYELNVSALDIGQGRFDEFEAFGAVSADDAGRLSFVTSGQDIGAAFDPSTGRVAIPPSFQSLDLGILAPNDDLLIRYTFRFLLSVGSDVGQPGSSEGLGARFSDPLNLASTPVLGPIQLTPAGPPPPAAVPEPSTLALCMLGASAWAAGRRHGIVTRRR